MVTAAQKKAAQKVLDTPDDEPIDLSPTKPDLKGFEVGQPAPRTIFEVYEGGYTPAHLVLSATVGERGSVLCVEGDVVTQAQYDRLHA